MDNRRPLVQALVGALSAALLLTAYQIFQGSRPAGMTIRAFIVVMTLVAGLLTYIRAEGIRRGSAGGHESPLMRTPLRIALTFAGIFLYGCTFFWLFVSVPGDSAIEPIVSALVLSTILVTLMYRRSRHLATSSWKIVGGTVTLGVTAGIVAWAVEKFV